jgi:hypothetical protein
VIVLAESDGRLVTRLIQRLMSGGLEVRRLRSLLLLALIDAAHLAGDKGEAAELGAQLEQLARESVATSGAC